MNPHHCFWKNNNAMFKPLIHPLKENHVPLPSGWQCKKEDAAYRNEICDNNDNESHFFIRVVNNVDHSCMFCGRFLAEE